MLFGSSRRPTSRSRRSRDLSVNEGTLDRVVGGMPPRGTGDRLIATVVQAVIDGSRLVGHHTGGEEGAALGVGDWFDQWRLDVGCPVPGNGSVGELAAGDEPGREAAHRPLSMRAVPGTDPVSGMPATQWSRQTRLIGMTSRSAHQRR